MIGPGQGQAGECSVDRVLRLDESLAIDTWTYVDQAEPYAEFKEIFADTPEMIDTVTPGILPPSYRVVPVDPDADAVEELGDQFLGQPGVRKVVFAGETFREIQDLSDMFGVVLGIGSLRLLGAGLAIASNYALRLYVIDEFGNADALQLVDGFQVENSELFRTNLIVLLVAVGVSVIGSAVAVTR